MALFFDGTYVRRLIDIIEIFTAEEIVIGYPIGDFLQGLSVHGGLIILQRVCPVKLSTGNRLGNQGIISGGEDFFGQMDCIRDRFPLKL
jgi:hypothetical protein